MSRRRLSADKCFCLYHLMYMLGMTKGCGVCHVDEFTCKDHNYILHFTGRGKYNNKYLCLDCLEKRIKQS